MQKINGVGGTPGGIWTFIIGAVMVVAGGFLFVNHVKVGYGFLNFFGRDTQGLVLIPLIAGITFLFFNGKSIIGWVLTIAGALIIFLGVIVSLRFYFPQTSLYNLIIMLVLLFGGIGLVIRSLRSVS